VRCSEPCDALAALGAYDSAAYAVPANRRTTFHLDTTALRERLREFPGRTRLRMTVTVSDRAGNTVTRRRSFAVRIVK
jgi:hypothetical protein